MVNVIPIVLLWGVFFRERECMDDEAKNKNDVIAAVKSFTILLLC